MGLLEDLVAIVIEVPGGTEIRDLLDERGVPVRGHDDGIVRQRHLPVSLVQPSCPVQDFVRAEPESRQQLAEEQARVLGLERAYAHDLDAVQIRVPMRRDDELAASLHLRLQAAQEGDELRASSLRPEVAVVQQDRDATGGALYAARQLADDPIDERVLLVRLPRDAEGVAESRDHVRMPVEVVAAVDLHDFLDLGPGRCVAQGAERHLRLADALVGTRVPGHDDGVHVRIHEVTVRLLHLHGPADERGAHVDLWLRQRGHFAGATIQWRQKRGAVGLVRLVHEEVKLARFQVAAVLIAHAVARSLEGLPHLNPAHELLVESLREVARGDVPDLASAAHVHDVLHAALEERSGHRFRATRTADHHLGLAVSSLKALRDGLRRHQLGQAVFLQHQAFVLPVTCEVQDPRVEGQLELLVAGVVPSDPQCHSPSLQTAKQVFSLLFVAQFLERLQRAIRALSAQRHRHQMRHFRELRHRPTRASRPKNFSSKMDSGNPPPVQLWSGKSASEVAPLLSRRRCGADGV
mmetsp:Transcript_6846/g.26445  ORF Transcript_6846/g.26445 Transcript_6846/m.26445 type:complete len:523 (+) Transcript_6846:919-2487(+)